MLRKIFLTIFALTLLFTFSNDAFARINVEALIKNQNKEAVFNELENIILMHGDRIQAKKPESGIIQVHVGVSSCPAPLNKIPQALFLIGRYDEIHWRYTIQVKQIGDDVLVISHCYGGIAPGRFFRRAIRTLGRRNFDVLYVKNALISKYEHPKFMPANGEIAIPELFNNYRWTGFVSLPESEPLNAELKYANDKISLIIQDKTYPCYISAEGNKRMELTVLIEDTYYELIGSFSKGSYSGKTVTDSLKNKGSFSFKQYEIDENHANLK